MASSQAFRRVRVSQVVQQQVGREVLRLNDERSVDREVAERGQKSGRTLQIDACGGSGVSWVPTRGPCANGTRIHVLHVSSEYLLPELAGLKPAQVTLGGYAGKWLLAPHGPLRGRCPRR